jgi:glyoxylase-like metal-dependent hydrolase (beta-lactamase superfamily II)
MAMTRRTFVGSLGGCAAHVLWMSVAGGAASRLWAAERFGKVVQTEPWGRLEEVGPGMWALVSTPLAGPRGSDAWRTVCNGGIIAGRDEVLLVEAFATPEGAAWLAAAAERLTGRPATLAVVTHFHGDHTGGIAAYITHAPTIPVRSTPTTRDLLKDKAPLPDPVIPEAGVSELDLGGRVVRLTPRLGHTPSDVTLEVSDPRVLWCGDLVWNRMFPNYVNAIPSKHAASLRAILAEPDALYVPGHGPLAKRADIELLLTLLDDVEQKARAAIASGAPLEAAASHYTLPAGVADWAMFSPSYFRVAFQAWTRELKGESQ